MLFGPSHLGQKDYSWHLWSPKATWTNTTRIAKSTALKRGTSRKRHKLGYGRIVVVMLVNIFMLSLCWRFSYSPMQFPPSILKLSTQHPPYLLKLSTQHQPTITRIENWAILPTQGLQFSYTFIRAFSKISAYTKTVQFYSTKNTSMNKFLAQGSSPCLMLGGIPPASLSEGWLWRQPSVFALEHMDQHSGLITLINTFPASLYSHLIYLLTHYSLVNVLISCCSIGAPFTNMV